MSPDHDPVSQQSSWGPREACGARGGLPASETEYLACVQVDERTPTHIWKSGVIEIHTLHVINKYCLKDKLWV